MLLTALTPEPTYTWYPASAPPMAWETALVLRAFGQVAKPFELTCQLQLPLLSRETREWDGVRRSYWGRAPFEGKLLARWAVLSATNVELEARFFARPWEHWEVFGDAAYRQGSLRLSVEQRL
jgi:hypothetical protein